MLKPRPWQEPAHSVVVKRFDDLVVLYKYLREDLQALIDKTFDKVARQIGFVVATTLPVTVEAGKGGKVTEVKLGTAYLEETIFANEFAPVFRTLKENGFGRAKVATGSYQLIFIWYDALKLKLKHDWMEPAHFQPVGTEIASKSAAQVKVRPEVQEPAHWFDAGITLDAEEELLISVIDEVYPELKLVDRVAMGRVETRNFVPGVREPAHFHNGADFIKDPGKIQLLTELSSVLRKPEV